MQIPLESTGITFFQWKNCILFYGNSSEFIRYGITLFQWKKCLLSSGILSEFNWIPLEFLSVLEHGAHGHLT